MLISFAIVLTHNRPDDLKACITAIEPQVDQVVIVDNASTPPVDLIDFPSMGLVLIRDEEQPPNLARLMNLGMDQIKRSMCEGSNQSDAYASRPEWDVAILCDDVVAPAGWFKSVSTAIRGTGAAAGATHSCQPVAEPILKTSPDGDIYNRMQGSACVLRGEVGLRADENMRWWWQDTDLDWQARAAGGMVIAPGPVALNSKPNDFTHSRPELYEQACRDRETFQVKWGWNPW